VTLTALPQTNNGVGIVTAGSLGTADEFYAALVGMVLAYLVLIGFGKLVSYRATPTTTPTPRRYSRTRHLILRAAHFSTGKTPTRAAPDSRYGSHPAEAAGRQG
jgi:hypothetical protein